MAIRKDRVQLDIEINGRKAGETYKDLINQARDLKRSLLQLTPGTEDFIKKSEELQKVNTKLAEINAATKAINQELGRKPADAYSDVVRTYSELQTEAKNLAAQLQKLTPGTQEFISKSQELDAVKQKLSAVESEMQAINEAVISTPTAPYTTLQAQYTALQSQIRNTAAELAKLTPGTEDFIQKSKELDKVKEQFKEIDDQIKQIDSNIDKSSPDTFLTKFAKIGGILFALKEVGGYIGSLVTEASKLDTIQDKYNTVFGDATVIVDKFAQDTAISLGLSVNKFKEVTAATGDLLIPIGFAREEAASMSNDVVNLSASLALWEGGTRSTEEITKILNKALLGEREELKQLGVAISEADVKERLKSKGLEKATGETLKQAKAIATLELITEGSADAITQFTTKQESMSAVSARTSAKLRTLYDNFIELIKPAVNFGLVITEKVVGGLIFLVSYLATLPRFINENKVAILGIIAGMILFNGQLILASANSLRLAAAERARAIITRSIAIAQNLLNAAMSANPIGIVIRLIGLLVAGLAVAYNNVQSVRASIAGLGSIAVEIFKIVKESVASFVEGFKALKEGRVGDALDAFGDAFVKSNPVGIALTQGTRLASAFKKGFDDKIKSEELEASAKITTKTTTSTANNTVKKPVLDDLVDNSTGDPKKSAFDKALEAQQEANKKALQQLEIDQLETNGRLEENDLAYQARKLAQIEKNLIAEKSIYDKFNKTDSSDFRDLSIQQLETKNKITALPQQVSQKAIEDLATSEEQQLQIQLSQKLITQEQFDEQILQAKNAGYQRQLDLLKQYGQQESDLYKETNVKKIQVDAEIVELTTQQKIDNIEKEAQQSITEDQKKFISKILTEEHFEQQRLQKLASAKEQELALLTSLGQQDTDLFRDIEQQKLDIQQQMLDKQLENEKRTADLKKALQEKALGAAQDALSVGIQLLSKDEAARKKNATAIKAFESGRILVNMYSEISGLRAGYAALGPAGQIIANIQTGISILRAFAAIRSVQAQKFALGGRVQPNGQSSTVYNFRDFAQDVSLTAPQQLRTGIIPSSLINIPTQSNGDSVLATVKPGEVIMNEPQQEGLKRIAGPDIFQRLRIPGFALGGLVAPISPIPPILPSSPAIDNTYMQRGFEKMNNAIDRLIVAADSIGSKELKAKVVYTEFDTISTEIERIKSFANA